MGEILDLRSTIIPKSDQLNADQLLAGPMTITVSRVTARAGDQPVIIHFDGDGGRPYKPCLTMRKVLVHAWGHDGNAWIGRSMRLYLDPDVRFGGETVGGVRISHLSDIERDVVVSLAATRGKKAQHRILRLVQGDAALIAAIRVAADVEALKAAFAAAYKTTKAEDRRAAFKGEYDRRMQELAPSDRLQAYIAKVQAADNYDRGAEIVDEARTVFQPAELEELNRAFADRFDANKQEQQKQ